jgi:hypothetical protein
MRQAITIILILFSFSALAQYRITGKILDSADKKPVPGVTVFLANASVGTASNIDGTFTLENVHSGQYDLVVSMVGYRTHHEVLMVNSDLTLKPIFISAKSIALNEVKITPNAEWEHNYSLFKQEFLGTSAYAKDCKILNPEILDLQFDKSKRVLTAAAQDFLIIENKALGYKIKYLLSDFEKDYKQGSLYYAGSASFEGMTGKKSAEKKWAKNRLAVYKGSSMHFLRAAMGNDLAEQGFKVLRLIRKPNPKYTGLGDKYIDQLVKTPLAEDAYVSRTDEKNLFALKFDDCLYVMFNGGKPVEGSDNNPAGIGWITTTVMFSKPYAIFDANGIFTDPTALIFDGDWGLSRMATMLPVDYEQSK